MSLRTFYASAAVALFAAAALPAHATEILWTLSGVTFDDGAAASGTFETDPTTGDILTWDITTTAGATLGGFTYSGASYGGNAFNDFNGTANSFVVANNNPNDEPPYSPYLELVFTDPLTTTETDAIVTDGGTVNGSKECLDCSDIRFVTGGTATGVTVPEPAAWALMLVGFGGLGASLRSRRKAAVVAA
jgi:hypothetical protein